MSNVWYLHLLSVWSNIIDRLVVDDRGYVNASSAIDSKWKYMEVY